MILLQFDEEVFEQLIEDPWFPENSWVLGYHVQTLGMFLKLNFYS